LNPAAAAGNEPRDEILDDLLKDERRAQEIIQWFQLNEHVDVSTLDLAELEQIFAEHGPGTTLANDHEPYPNVRIISFIFFLNYTAF
jgi:hypothetical protein